MDLARLARLLPATLRLRQQVEINSGQVQLALSSRPEQQGMTWHGQLDAAELDRHRVGTQDCLAEPPSLVLDAHETPAGPVVDAPAVRVGLPQDSRQRHARRAGRLVELQPQAVGRPTGPIRRSGDACNGAARAGATSTGNARRSNCSTPTPISGYTTSSCAAGPVAVARRRPDRHAFGQRADRPRRQTRIDSAALSIKSGADQLPGAAIQVSNVVLAGPANGPMELGGTLKYQADLAADSQVV